MKEAVRKFKAAKVDRIVLLPLFPQFASSSTGSAIEYALKEISSWQFIPELKVLSSYYNTPEFIQLWANKAKAFQPENYDTILFTFHGVPWRHIRTSGCSGSCQQGPQPCPAINDQNHICYRAQCFASANGVIQQLGLPKEKTIISFQSRLGKDPWLTPYTDHTLIDLAKAGKKKVLVFSMAFVADCLETIHEVGTEYNELFQHNGGESVTLIPSLNDDDAWVDYLSDLVTLPR